MWSKFVIEFSILPRTSAAKRFDEMIRWGIDKAWGSSLACSVGTRGANCEMQEREVAPGVLLVAAAMLETINDARRHVRSWGCLYSQSSTSLSLDTWDAVRSDSSVPTTNEVS